MYKLFLSLCLTVSPAIAENYNDTQDYATFIEDWQDDVEAYEDLTIENYAGGVLGGGDATTLGFALDSLIEASTQIAIAEGHYSQALGVLSLACETDDASVKDAYCDAAANHLIMASIWLAFADESLAEANEFVCLAGQANPY